jgi:GT2 family glycosyltransferase
VNRRHPLRQFEPTTRASLRASFTRTGHRTFSGYAISDHDPAQKYAIEILVDGLPVKLVAADSYVVDLEDIGDACHGFAVTLPEETVETGAVIEARVANRGDPVSGPIALDAPFESARHAGPGALRWNGGLRFSGWIDTTEPDAFVTLMVDGVAVTRARAAAWTNAGDDGARAVRAFDVHLPPRFADGAVHLAEARNARAESLAGSPLAFMAFAVGLDETMLTGGAGEQNRARAEMFNRLMPGSVPFSEYEASRKRLPEPPAPKRATHCAIVLVGDGDSEESLASLPATGAESWAAAALPTDAAFGSFRNAELVAFLADGGAACDFVLFALAGTTFAPFALRRLAHAVEIFPDARVVYADYDAQGPDGSVWPVALTAFDYERQLEQGCASYIYALRRDVARRSASSGATDLHQLFLGALDRDDAGGSVAHVPGAIGVLPAFDIQTASEAIARATGAHLLVRGLDVDVTPREGAEFPSVRVHRAIAWPSVTLMIPTRNQPKLLRRCIDSLRPAVDSFGAEIMIIDNDSSDAETLAYLDELVDAGAAVLRAPGPFNFARINNRAAEAASGDVLVLVNDDIEARDADWLGEMLSRLAEPDVGAVGALLLWPSGVVQHGGVVFGPKFEPAHAFRDRMDGEPGYAGMLRVAHECSAVTAACLATRREDYLAVGGMDELNFPVNFNDADYCLKLRALGKRIVFTPDAKLLHHESASRGSDRASDRRPRYERELRNLRLKWGDALAADPYYSPVLALDGNPYSALAAPARSVAPRLNNLPRPRQPPAWL